MRQNAVSLGDLLEALAARIIPVDVRVILFCQLFEQPLDLVGTRVLTDAQDLVIVLLEVVLDTQRASRQIWLVGSALSNRERLTNNLFIQGPPTRVSPCCSLGRSAGRAGLLLRLRDASLLSSISRGRTHFYLASCLTQVIRLQVMVDGF
jgi:hypothetical protein